MTDNQASGVPPDNEHKAQLDKFFKAAVKTQASDIHLKVGQSPKLRLYGELKNTTGEVMTKERMEEIVFEIMSESRSFLLRPHLYLFQ